MFKYVKRVISWFKEERALKIATNEQMQRVISHAKNTGEWEKFQARLKFEKSFEEQVLICKEMYALAGEEPPHNFYPLISKK